MVVGSFSVGISASSAGVVWRVGGFVSIIIIAALALLLLDDAMDA